MTEYIPATRKGYIITTSQDHRVLGLGPGVELGEMKPEDAEMLFMKKAQIHQLTTDQKAVCTKIVTKLGWLALAVETSAVYVPQK